MFQTPNFEMAIALCFFGIAGGFMIVKLSARHIEYFIWVTIGVIFGWDVANWSVVQLLMKCGYLTILAYNLSALILLMIYEILF